MNFFRIGEQVCFEHHRKIVVGEIITIDGDLAVIVSSEGEAITRYLCQLQRIS